MNRYFDVDSFLADVQNRKIELEGLSERLERLKDSICSYALEDTKEDEIKLPFRFRTNKLYEDVPAYGRRFVHDWERRFREDLRKQNKKGDQAGFTKLKDSQLASPPTVKARKSTSNEVLSTESAPDALESLRQKLRALKSKGVELRQSVINFKDDEHTPSEVSQGSKSPVLRKPVRQRMLQPTGSSSRIPSPAVDRKRTAIARKGRPSSVPLYDHARAVKTGIPRPTKRLAGVERPSVDENFRCLQRYVTRQRLQRRNGTFGARLPTIPRVVREPRSRPAEGAPSAPIVKTAGKSEDVLRKIRSLYENRTPNSFKNRPVKALDSELLPGFRYDDEAQNCVIENIRKRYFGLMGPDAMYRIVRHREFPPRGTRGEASGQRTTGKVRKAPSIPTGPETENNVVRLKSQSPNASSVAAQSDLATSDRSAGESGRMEESGSASNFKSTSPEGSPDGPKPAIVGSSDEQPSKSPTPNNHSLMLNLQSSSSESVVTVQPSDSEPLLPAAESPKATPKAALLADRKDGQQRSSKKTARTESEVSEIPLEANNGSTSASRSLAKANSGRSQNSWGTEEEIFGRDMVKHSRRIYGKSDESREDDLHRWASIHMKALKAYFEVQIALVHCEKKFGYRKNAEENVKFIDEQVLELKRKFERESQSLQGSVVSVVDEIREVALLQEKTVALQKNLAEMCRHGYPIWPLEKTPLFDEQKKLLKQREAQAKRLIKERKALEKDAKVVAKLESKAFRAWSLPAGLWKLSSSLSSSSEATTNGRAKPQVARCPVAEEDLLTPLSGRSEYNARIQALKKELEQRKNVARRLTYEYNQRSKQQLMSHEKSLAKQIEIYEGNIQKTEQMISDLISAKSRGEVRTSPRMITSPRSSGRSARQLDALLDEPTDKGAHIDVLNLESGRSISSGSSLSESEAKNDGIQSEREVVPEKTETNKLDLERAQLPSFDTSQSDTEPLVVDSSEVPSAMPPPLSEHPFWEVKPDVVDNAASEITTRLLSDVAASCQNALRELGSEKRAFPEPRPDKPTVISTFDAISPRLLQSSLHKAAEFPTTPFVPKLELRDLADEAEKDDRPLLDADGTPRVAIDSYSLLAPAPLVSSSKEAVRAIVGVSVDSLLKQLAKGQSLWKTPKAAELYFVACELANHRRGNSEHFDHLFREFIFDLCRDFVANIYGCKDKAECVGEPASNYAFSSQMAKGDDRLVKQLVDRLVFQSIFSSSRHARIEAVARRSWDDVDSRILSEMYEHEAAFSNTGAIEEEVRNASADAIVSQQVPVVVEECFQLVHP